MVFVEKTFPRGGEVKHRKVQAEGTSKQQVNMLKFCKKYRNSII